MVPRDGFGPPYRDSKSRVLPLDDRGMKSLLIYYSVFLI